MNPEVERMERLRKELGFADPSKFAREIGIDPSTYLLYLRDKRRPGNVCRDAIKQSHPEWFDAIFLPSNVDDCAMRHGL